MNEDTKCRTYSGAEPHEEFLSELRKIYLSTEIMKVLTYYTDFEEHVNYIGRAFVK